MSVRTLTGLAPADRRRPRVAPVLAVALTAASLAAGLTACSPKTPDFSGVRAEVAALPGVEDATVRMTRSGLPTNTTLKVVLVVDADADLDRLALLRGSLEAAWAQDQQEPQAGVAVTLVHSGTDPERLTPETTTSLSDVVPELGLGGDEYSDLGTSLDVYQSGMVSLYGDWPDYRK